MENVATHWEKIVEISSPIYKETPLVHLNNTGDTNFHWAKFEDLVIEEINWVKNNKWGRQFYKTKILDHSIYLNFNYWN